MTARNSKSHKMNQENRSALDALGDSFSGTIRAAQQKQHVGTKARVHAGGPFVTSGTRFSGARHRASYLFARGCIRPTTERSFVRLLFAKLRQEDER